MRCYVAVLALVSLVPGGWAAAAERKGGRRADAEVREVLEVLAPVLQALGAAEARHQEAPRLLTDALRTGTLDGRDAAAIVRWVLTEKEETVAAGLSASLQELKTTSVGPDGERWNATSAAVIEAFQGLLQDAQTHRRRDGEAVFRELAKIALPAVIEALREPAPAARERREDEPRAPQPPPD
jgi:hypothetical protein